MRNKTQLFTTIGIMLLIIGTTFLACTIYRSTYTSGGTISNFPPGKNPLFWGPASLSPRNYAIKLNLTYYDAMFNLDPISSVDFYLLDSKGGELWLSEGVIEPVWSAKEASPTGTLQMKILHRGDYFVLLVNPDNSNMSGDMYPSLYGYESDLLWFSITTLIIGSIITIVSTIRLQNKNKQQSPTVDLKNGSNTSSNSAVSLSKQKVMPSVSSVKSVDGSRFKGQLHKLLIWELETSFTFPMLEVILIIAILTVLAPTIIEVSPTFRYINLLSGIQPIFLFLIFIAGVLFCHSYAGNISRGETKMVLSYPIQRSKLFLSKFIALFTVLSVIYVGIFVIQIPLLALNPFEPLFYASMLLLLLQIFLICTISTVLSVVTKNEVLSILTSVLLLFGIESIASRESLATFTGRFTAGFDFAREYVYGGLSSTTLTTDMLVSVFVVLGVSVLLFICSYGYFTRKMEID